MELEQKITNRINEIKQAREDFIRDANDQIGKMNMTMIELAKLLGNPELLPEDLRPQEIPTPETLEEPKAE